MIDLKTRKPITRPKVTPIPVTDTVIKAVEAAAERDGVKSFKFLDRNKINIDHDSFIAGVQEENDSDYHDEDYTDTEQEEDEDLEFDEEITEAEKEDLEDEDPEELAEITGVDENDVTSLDAGQNQVGNDQLDPIEEHQENQEDDPPQVSDNESEISELRRSTRETRQPENLNVSTMKGQSYLQKLEQVHNLVVQSISKKKNDANSLKYNKEQGMVLAIMISEIRRRSAKLNKAKRYQDLPKSE